MFSHREESKRRVRGVTETRERKTAMLNKTGNPAKEARQNAAGRRIRASLGWIVALAGCAPAIALATITSVTITGTFTEGTDIAGSFIGKGADLAGKAFTLEWEIDSSRAPLVFIPQGGPFT